MLIWLLISSIPVGACDQHPLKKNKGIVVAWCFFKHFRYVSSILPTGSEDLRGDEVETIIKFKTALGIDDPDAAAMHMEVILFFFLL